ncbi:MAG TPA: TonB C-terminal domain-containing protein [Stellaceae bacterium]|jgi:outer membrane biosynthesis protein TonB|nr:TonB C-terminal domain-containing protein [Stellaceae bacterium]
MKVRQRPGDLLDLFEIDPLETSLPAGEWPDPALVLQPYLVEFAEGNQLDPERAVGDVPDEKPSPSRPPLPSRGMAPSLAIHLLPLLLLIAWWTAPPDIAQPGVPVQLVFEEQPEASPPEDQPPAPGHIAAEKMAQATPQPTKSEPTKPEPTKPEPTKPEPAKSAPAPTPTPTPRRLPPVPPKMAAAAPPKPAPAPVRSAEPPSRPVPRNPAPRAAVTPPPSVTTVAARQPAPERQSVPERQPLPERPREAAGAPVSGPADSRDAYFAYLVTLTRQHIDMLPMNMIGGRRGRTVIAVRVLDDGTIAGTRVASSSTYPDIDARIQQMVVAVGRFPPLPPSLRGRDLELDLKLNFPDAVE